MNFGTILILLAIGLSAGVFGGMVGLGGGVIMIPAMIFFLGLSVQTAQGTSLAVMIPPIGLLAVMNYYKAGQLNFKYAALIAIGFFIGGYFGSKIALSISPEKMKRIFAVALMLIAINMFIKK